MHAYLLYAAYGWLLIGGILHFSIDVLAQYFRGKRVPSQATTLYYGLNTAFGLGQVMFALLALFAINHGVAALGQWPGLILGFGAALAWFAISVFFLEYRQPRMVIGLFAALLAGATLTAG